MLVVGKGKDTLLLMNECDDDPKERITVCVVYFGKIREPTSLIRRRQNILWALILPEIY